MPFNYELLIMTRGFRGSTYGEEDENGHHCGLVDSQRLGELQAFVLVSFVLNQTEEPWCTGAISLEGVDFQVIHEDEDNGEEDDIDQNDQDNRDSSPLELNHPSDPSVGLPGSNGASYAVRISCSARTVGCRRIIRE